MGDQATQNGRDRTSGFADCMKKDFPDIKVIEQPTNWTDRQGDLDHADGR